MLPFSAIDLLSIRFVSRIKSRTFYQNFTYIVKISSQIKFIVVVSWVIRYLASFDCSFTAFNESYKTYASSFTCGYHLRNPIPFSRQEDPNYYEYPNFVLDCNGGNSPSIDIKNMTYSVLSINQLTQRLKIIRIDGMKPICPHGFINTTISHNLYDYSSTYTNIIFEFNYGCLDSFSLHFL